MRAPSLYTDLVLVGTWLTRAAMIYQHATGDRDRKIAEGLDRMITEARSDAEKAGNGQADAGAERTGDSPPAA
jgi:hypothetical protein